MYSAGVELTVGFVADRNLLSTQNYRPLLFLLPENIVAIPKFTHIANFIGVRGKKENF